MIPYAERPYRKGVGVVLVNRAGLVFVGQRIDQTTDLPPALADSVWKARFRGQEQKWYVCRFTGETEDIDVTGVEHPEFSAWKWAAPDEALRLIVPFKRELYQRVFEELREHIRPEA